jgi:hypothetical protein
LHENPQGKDKNTIASAIKEQLYKLQEEIKEIQFMEIGVNAPEASDENYDVVLIAEFKNFKDLETYQKHPAHVRFKEFIKPLRSDKIAVDYVK